MTPKRTMAIAQQLYEGVDVAGMGTLGLITYMRTDSLRLSDEAMDDAAKFICSRYGKAYYYGKHHVFKTKSGAQDAHEAIRPTNAELEPDAIQSSLTREQYRLYKLIWSRFMASQMANAVYDTVSIDAVCAGHVFRATHQSVKFAGFLALYEESHDEETQAVGATLPPIAEGDTAACAALAKEQHFTQPPARYTEASLVKAMEEKGVGRPSTYAGIVSTIQDREYVNKVEKHLMPTPLGEVVTGLMMDKFTDIIDVEFTAGMENELDRVEAGQRHWKALLGDFYKDFHQAMLQAEEALAGTRLKVPDEESTEICEMCGRTMVVKTGRFGKFMSWDVPTAEDCPKCGQTMFKKAGKGRNKPFCINESCENFLPEDKRGYYKKGEKSEDKKPSKKTSRKKEA